MARKEDKHKAILLRKKGYSYSQIKAEIGVSKSTLSGWLKDMPLSEKRLRKLRDTSEIRIEKTRETKRRRKELRRQKVYEQVAHDIASSGDIDFVAGFYLYWGEGTKTAEYSVSLTNSDPAVVRCFVEWLERLGVERKQLKVKLHLYVDQDESEQIRFWSNVCGVSVNNFYKTYRKQSLASRKTYKGMFSHGTCVVIYNNRDTYEYVLAGVQYLRNRLSSE
jgi:transcriptional regulator with XRE-family HTH domain